VREESCPLEGDEEEEEEDFLLFRRTAFSRFSSCEELALPSPSLASSSSLFRIGPERKKPDA
jgi:hypothetical protein